MRPQVNSVVQERQVTTHTYQSTHIVATDVQVSNISEHDSEMDLNPIKKKGKKRRKILFRKKK